MLESIIKRCDKISLILLYVLMADVCVFGAGKLVSVGPLTFRMILLALTALVALPVMFKNLSYLIKNKYTWIIGGFCVWLVFSTALGIQNQNPTNLILTDIKGFLYFALFPITMCLIRTQQRAETLSKVMMYSSATMGFLHIFCMVWYLWYPDSLISYAVDAFEKHFFYISFIISPTNVRINFLSLVCLLFGCALSVYYQVKEQTTWKKYVYALVTAVCLFAILISYTRSIYLAAGVTAVCTVLIFLFRTDRTQKKRLVIHLCGSVVIFFAIVTAFRVGTGTDYFHYGLTRALVGSNIGSTSQGDVGITEDNTDTEEVVPPTTELKPGPGETDELLSTTISSDNLRSITVNELVQNIRSSPVLGLGLGATIASRPNGLNEYFFLDLSSKMGLVGLCLYLAPLAFMMWDLMKLFRTKSDTFHLSAIWVAVILGFVAYSYFTPCMNSSVGIMCYCCAMAVLQQSSISLSMKTIGKV